MVTNNTVDISSNGIVTYNNTSGAFSGSTVTQHGVVIAAANNTLSSVSGSTGQVLLGNTSADPSFGTCPVGSGGTGASSFTAYSVICAGTTSTGAFQNVSGVGSSGQVLTSNGASALPTWQAASAGGLTYNVVTTNQSMAVGNAYINNDTSSHDFTLPSTAAVGSRVAVGRYNTGGCVVKQNAGQTILFGTLTTTSGTGGTITSQAQGDWIDIVCIVANTGWMVDGQTQGNWSVV